MAEKKKIKVLIIDDDLTLREMYAERMMVEDYDVHIAKDGDEGIKMAKEVKPDVVLLDIMMPGTNGFGVLESLQKDPTTESIPILMLSALIQEENKAKSKDGGAIGYIVKSETTPADVIEKIKKTLTPEN
jgi:DNA-binding response OmpR family regulator